MRQRQRGEVNPTNRNLEEGKEGERERESRYTAAATTTAAATANTYNATTSKKQRPQQQQKQPEPLSLSLSLSLSLRHQQDALSSVDLSQGGVLTDIQSYCRGKTMGNWRRERDFGDFGKGEREREDGWCKLFAGDGVVVAVTDALLLFGHSVVRSKAP